MYAALPAEDFMKAWGSDTIGYGEGRFPLRTGFTDPIGAPDAWAAASVPFALNWAEGNEAIPGFPAGNIEGLNELGNQATDGILPDVTIAVLRDFAIRLGARRRADAACFLSNFPELSNLLSRQASVIGSAQISVIDSDWISFSQQMTDVAGLHGDILSVLRTLDWVHRAQVRKQCQIHRTSCRSDGSVC